mmetsp:Transcript_76791/g.217287  ORF Transcript_76791/g.217287 Transcript_76791/m.217287 type:complete len:221 (+) Transcript_76791:2579-3241(+)
MPIHCQEVSDVFVVDLHSLHSNIQGRATGREYLGLPLELVSHPRDQAHDCVCLPAAGGAVGQDTHGVATGGCDEVVLQSSEHGVIARIDIEKVIEREEAGLQQGCSTDILVSRRHSRFSALHGIASASCSATAPDVLICEKSTRLQEHLQLVFTQHPEAPSLTLTIERRSNSAHNANSAPELALFLRAGLLLVNAASTGRRAEGVRQVTRQQRLLVPFRG